jgi:hypothetical protein
MKKIIFEDLPSTKTPLNATNLNQIQTNIETAIDETTANLNTLINEVVESGKNELGEWIKLSNGTMISVVESTETLSCTNTWGSLFYGSSNTPFYFPEEYIEPPKVIKDLKITSGSNSFIPFEFAPSKITEIYFSNYGIARGQASENVQVTITLLIIGKWK